MHMPNRRPWTPSWSGGTPTPPSDSDDDNDNAVASPRALPSPVTPVVKKKLSRRFDSRPPWSPSWSGGTPTPPSDSDDDTDADVVSSQRGARRSISAPSANSTPVNKRLQQQIDAAAGDDSDERQFSALPDDDSNSSVGFRDSPARLESSHSPVRELSLIHI